MGFKFGFESERDQSTLGFGDAHTQETPCDPAGPSRPHPCLPFASPSPVRCCFLGTSFGEVPLLLAGFLLPLNCAPSVGALLRSMKPLSWTSSVKILTSVNRLISSGISTFVMLARVYLCRGDHVLRCSWLMCRSKSSSLKKSGALQVKACERCFRFRRFLSVTGSGRSIHETPSTSNSLHNVSSRYNQLEKTVSHIGHALEVVIVVTQSFNPCVPPTSCAAVDLCVSKLGAPTSRSSAVFCGGGHFCAPESCSDHN